MSILIDDFLTGYLELRDEVYKPTETYKDHPKTRELIATKLREWAHSQQKFLSDYGQGLPKIV